MQAELYSGAEPVLAVTRMGIYTYQEPVVYMRADCAVCRSEGFEAEARVEIRMGTKSIEATLHMVAESVLPMDTAGLSELAWQMLGASEGALARFSHPRPLDSLAHVRAKIYGHPLGPEAIGAVIRDVAIGRYSPIQLAAFIAGCAGVRMNRAETVALTRSMVEVGERLEWPGGLVVDKHCVGGLPGNRTTPIVVAIVSACGLLIPKTSSRAITSPAGTADTMETLAPVDLDLQAMRRVVEREGGCVVWGGAVRLSPADDVLIRIERPLDLDSEGQLVASVLSKKVAAGSTHVVIDIPVGPTAKVRSRAAAEALEGMLTRVGEAVGLQVRIVCTDGRQPVGRGIGPALEARDILAVLQGSGDAPRDLRERSLLLAGHILELGRFCPAGTGSELAEEVLDGGRAWAKFQAICEAQGGMREPPAARQTYAIEAMRSGVVAAIDNRRLAKAAKLAGAPASAAAGVQLHTPLGTAVEPGTPMFTLHSTSRGELDYALSYVRSEPEILALRSEP